jgi:hypothetical protein
MSAMTMATAAAIAPKLDEIGNAVKRASPGLPVGARRRPEHTLPCGQGGARIVGGEAGERAVDQVGIAARDSVGAEAEPLHDARPPVLDHHVGPLDQMSGGGEIRAALQVEDETAACRG